MNWSEIEDLRKLALDESYQRMTFPAWLYDICSEPYYAFLFLLAQNMRPMNSRDHVDRLELGVYSGKSLAHLAGGWKYGSVIGVDDTEHQLVPALQKYANYHIVIQDSLVFLDNYDPPPYFDIIHIDTIHEPAHVMQELKGAIDKLAYGGVICIDDIYINDEMQDWWESLDLPRRGYRDLHVTGFGVVLPYEERAMNPKNKRKLISEALDKLPYPERTQLFNASLKAASDTHIDQLVKVLGDNVKALGPVSAREILYAISNAIEGVSDEELQQYVEAHR